MVKIKRLFFFSSLLILSFVVVACSSGGSDTTYHNLTIDTKGQGTVTPNSGKYKADQEIELDASPDGGSVFKEWQGGISGTENPYQLIIDGDYAITAVFEEASLQGQVKISNKTNTSDLSSTSINSLSSTGEDFSSSEIETKTQVNLSNLKKDR
ncbi:MAG: InlB B-repeat-containing protein, partial [Bacillota bacterium]